ncbi:MAG: 3-hydroxyacyl-CoA dehydrogenase family protein [Planctomycetota bacterium]
MVERIAVLGAGTMGQGIAQIAATSGLDTCLHDLSEDALERARTQIEQMVQKGIDKGKLPDDTLAELQQKLRYDVDPTTAVADCDCVVEAIFEDLDLKAKVLGAVAENVSEECLLASNTSSLSITGIAARVPAPGRVVGMHFFNPVPIMALVEVVRGVDSADAHVQRTVELAKRLGKEPIVVRDTPGFATSRLGLVIGLEAMRMLESGVASAVEIDKAMELGYRHPMGPLKLTDLVGLDVRLAIAEHLHKEIGEQFRPPAILRNMVRAGRLGRKSGRGFYDW